MEKKNGCCSCEADMQKEVNELVDNVEGYSKEDQVKKRQEVDAAFSDGVHPRSDSSKTERK